VMVVVSDASILIHLAKVGLFHLLRSLYEELMIAPGVYVEVVERGWGFPGSFETERAIKENWVKLGNVSDRVRVRDLMRRYGISLGNAETIQLASEKKAELALADEAEVSALLEEHGVKARGCIGVLIEAAKKRIISTNQAKKGLRDLVDSGYRVGDTVLNQAYKLLGEEK